jgi:hypothetical protein
VLLFGDDTIDPNGWSLAPAPFLPSAFEWDAEGGLVASETALADTDGDGSPDVAIGRLPATTEEQARTLVDKIEARAGAAAAGRQVFVADNQNPGEPSFEVQARIAAARLQGSAPGFVTLAGGVAAARTALRNALAQGTDVVHYFGHGGPDLWADEAILRTSTAKTLTGPPAVVFTWTCLAQWYQYGYEPTVNETLLLNANGGAAAIFGPGSITELTSQAGLYERLYEELATPGITLGEAIRRAKARALRDNPGSRPAVHGFSLLGDPTLVVPGFEPPGIE